MRWLADECVSAALVAGLRAAGHDVEYMADVAPSESDAAVLARARADDRLLLTEDKYFGDLVFRRGGVVPGLVLLRIDPALKVAMPRLQAAIARFGDGLSGRYTIVEAGRFRSRSLRRGWPAHADQACGPFVARIERSEMRKPRPRMSLRSIRATLAAEFIPASCVNTTFSRA